MMHDFDSGPMFDEPFLFVNEDGERFMNEDCVFEEVNCVLRNQPKPGWYSQIFDDDYVEQVTEWGGKPTDKEKIQVYMPDVKMDRSAESGANVIESLIGTYCCDTLDELAAKLEIPADALKKSVARYNEMVDAGFDADFGKQAKYLKKIEKAPFWGIHKHVRVSALCAGVTVNENYQALRTDGEVIPNLWVTGFSAGQLCGSPRLVDVPGRHVGRALHHDRAHLRHPGSHRRQAGIQEPRHGSRRGGVGVNESPTAVAARRPPQPRLAVGHLDLQALQHVEGLLVEGVVERSGAGGVHDGRATCRGRPSFASTAFEITQMLDTRPTSSMLLNGGCAARNHSNKSAEPNEGFSNTSSVGRMSSAMRPYSACPGAPSMQCSTGRLRPSWVSK